MLSRVALLENRELFGGAHMPSAVRALHRNEMCISGISFRVRVPHIPPLYIDLQVEHHNIARHIGTLLRTIYMELPAAGR